MWANIHWTQYHYPLQICEKIRVQSSCIFRSWAVSIDLSCIRYFATSTWVNSVDSNHREKKVFWILHCDSEMDAFNTTLLNVNWVWMFVSIRFDCLHRIFLYRNLPMKIEENDTKWNKLFPWHNYNFILYVYSLVQYSFGIYLITLHFTNLRIHMLEWRLLCVDVLNFFFDWSVISLHYY